MSTSDTKEYESDPQGHKPKDWRVLPRYADAQISALEHLVERSKDIPHVKQSMSSWPSGTNIDLLIRRVSQSAQFEDVENAKTVEDIINALRSPDLIEIAERLRYLQEVVEEDEENDPIEFQSLRNFGKFTLRERLPTPQIGITLKGLVQAVWRLPHFGTLVMNFQKSGDITFSVLYNQRTPEGRRRKVSGELPSHRVMLCISDFVRELTAT